MDCSGVCTYDVASYGMALGDALSNVLFISVEQSLPVYPEDISVCTQRYNASQSQRVALTRPLNTVASNIMPCYSCPSLG